MKKFAINIARCDRAAGCRVRKECPVQAIQVLDGDYYIDMNLCRGCGICLKACPRNAVEESHS